MKVINNKTWKELNNCDIDEDTAFEYAEKLNTTPLVIKLLFKRGLDSLEECRKFINLDDCDFPDSGDLPDIDIAIERILKAKKNSEKIIVYGDYDADGVTSTALMCRYLTSLGLKVSYHIPSRFNEGYGLNADFIKSIAESGISLIITVDNGVSAFDEVELANSHGIDVIITDHHDCPDKLPNALAVVNPKRSDSKYENKNLAGVGVALKFCVALQTAITKDPTESLREIVYKYSYLSAIGTVADVMPLIGENRLLVKTGLYTIRKNHPYSISSLLFKSGTKTLLDDITSQTLGFNICPKINAAGRMGDVSPAIDLFMSDKKTIIDGAAEKLCDYNLQRQSEENRIYNEAIEMIDNKYRDKLPNVIVLSSGSWSSGIIGIVSSRITERYSLPSILISETDDGFCKGSGRSVEGFDLYNALLQCGDCLEKFGGHTLAAGITVSKNNIAVFESKINSAAEGKIDFEKINTKYFDLETSINDMSVDSAKSLEILEPYGSGNKTPLFLSRFLRVTNIAGMGENKHTCLTLEKNGFSFTALYFSKSPESLDIETGDEIDILYSMNANEFRGDVSFQAIIRDHRHSENSIDNCSYLYDIYNKVLSDQSLKDYTCFYPDKDFIGKVYISLKENNDTNEKYEINSICRVLGFYISELPKVLLSLKILDEIKVVSVNRFKDNSISVTFADQSFKSDLNNSTLYRKINNN